MTLSFCQEVYANEQCLKADKFFSPDRIRKKPSCFYFYQEDLIPLSDFCSECKVNFASSPDFNLKRIKIYRDSVNGGRWL